jgi:hypothetical protein
LNINEIASAICHSTRGSRTASGVAPGAASGREAPRSSASTISSAVSKRCFGSRATAFCTTLSSQIGTSGRSRDGARGSWRKRASW